MDLEKVFETESIKNKKIMEDLQTRLRGAIVHILATSPSLSASASAPSLSKKKNPMTKLYFPLLAAAVTEQEEDDNETNELPSSEQEEEVNKEDDDGPDMYEKEANGMVPDSEVDQELVEDIWQLLLESIKTESELEATLDNAESLKDLILQAKVMIAGFDANEVQQSLFNFDEVLTQVAEEFRNCRDSDYTSNIGRNDDNGIEIEELEEIEEIERRVYYDDEEEEEGEEEEEDGNNDGEVGFMDEILQSMKQGNLFSERRINANRNKRSDGDHRPIDFSSAKIVELPSDAEENEQKRNTILESGSPSSASSIPKRLFPSLIPQNIEEVMKKPNPGEYMEMLLQMKQLLSKTELLKQKNEEEQQSILRSQELNKERNSNITPLKSSKPSKSPKASFAKASGTSTPSLAAAVSSSTNTTLEKPVLSNDPPASTNGSDEVVQVLVNLDSESPHWENVKLIFPSLDVLKTWSKSDNHLIHIELSNGKREQFPHSIVRICPSSVSAVAPSVVANEAATSVANISKLKWNIGQACYVNKNWVQQEVGKEREWVPAIVMDVSRTEQWCFVSISSFSFSGCIWVSIHPQVLRVELPTSNYNNNDNNNNNKPGNIGKGNNNSNATAANPNKNNNNNAQVSNNNKSKKNNKNKKKN